MAGNLVQINLLGTRFSIQTDQSPDYIQTLLNRLSRRSLDIQKSLGSDDPLKAAIIMGLFLEDELAKSHEEYLDKKTQEEVERIHLDMLKSIDETLKN